MPDETTPPTPQAGEGGTDPQPQAGNPQPKPQAGDGETESISLEEARKLRREAQEMRRRLKVIDDEKAAAESAKLSEIERVNKQYAEQQEINERLATALFERDVHEDVAQYASELNFLDGIPSKYLARLLDWDEIEEADGKPANVKKLLGELAKAVPVFVKQEQQQQRPPALPANNPGRTTYGQPGGTVPGKRYTLDDIQWSR